MAHHRVGRPEVGREPWLRRDEVRVAERGIDPPGQRRGIERRLCGRIRQQRAELLPQPRCEVREADVRANAALGGDRQRQRATNRGAGNDHLVGGKHPAAAAGQPRQQQRRQRFVAVGEVDLEHMGPADIVGPGRDVPMRPCVMRAMMPARWLSA